MQAWLHRHTASGSADLELTYQSALGFICRLLEPVPVDAAWYRAKYTDVTGAIDRGVFRSAGHHFLLHGFFEGRLPFASEGEGRRHPLPFSSIRAMMSVRPARSGILVRIPREALTEIVEGLLLAVPVDDAWYRLTYPTAATAIARGDFPSSAAHFARLGYTERHWPFAIEVDEPWYLSRYPDVKQAVAKGVVASGQDHFRRSGYQEGRFPAGTYGR
jgi:hypothetical protein